MMISTACRQLSRGVVDLQRQDNQDHQETEMRHRADHHGQDDAE
jgi:hypothetical protein